MATEDSEPISRRKKIDALLDVARYKPRFTAGIVLLGSVTRIIDVTLIIGPSVEY